MVTYISEGDSRSHEKGNSNKKEGKITHMMSTIITSKKRNEWRKGTIRREGSTHTITQFFISGSVQRSDDLPVKEERGQQRRQPGR